MIFYGGYIVIIEKGITRIEQYAFFDCKSLTGINIPDGVVCFISVRSLPSDARKILISKAMQKKMEYHMSQKSGALYSGAPLYFLRNIIQLYFL